MNNDRKFSLGRRTKRTLDPPSTSPEIQISNDKLSNDQRLQHQGSQKDIEESILKEEAELHEQWSTEKSSLPKVKGWQTNATTVPSTFSSSQPAPPPPPPPDLLDTLEEVKETCVPMTTVAMQATKALHDFASTPTRTDGVPASISRLATHGMVSKAMVFQETDHAWGFHEVLSEVMKKVEVGASGGGGAG